MSSGSGHIHTRHAYTLHPKMQAMMALIESKVESVKQELFQAFQDELDGILLEISREHKIPLDALQSKYLYVSEGSESDSSPAPKAPRAPRKPKASASGGERPKCAATTAKGAPCRNLALAGGVFCACHSKAKGAKPAAGSRVDKLRREAGKGGVKPVSPPSSDSESDSEIEVKPKRAPPKRPAKRAPVKHSHPIGTEESADCGVCQTLGNAAAKKSADECSVTAEMKAQLDALFAKADEEEVESGDETESETVAEDLDAATKAQIDALFESGGEETEDDE